MLYTTILLPSANSIMQTIEQSRTVFNQKKQYRKYAVYLATWRFEEKRRNCSFKVMVWHASHFLLFPADVARPSGIGKENEVLRRETKTVNNKTKKKETTVFIVNFLQI